MDINLPDVVAELDIMFARYERALMDNDVAELTALFWQSELTLRYGVGEQLYGHAAIAAFRASRPGGAPKRRLQRTIITTYGRDFGTANTEFLRDGTVRVGRQSQSWVRMQQGWFIVSAHVSLSGDAH